MREQQALLMLDDGTCFEGFARGAKKESYGEVIFTTGMVGYQETLSDPSYSGQIIVFTAAQMGNYGTTSLDDEFSGPACSGAVFHDFFIPPAGDFPHWRAEKNLDEYLAQAGITSISGIDTRSLTLHLREHGSRNGIISAVDFDKASLLRRAKELPSMSGLDLVQRVTCKEKYTSAIPQRVLPGFSQAPASVYEGKPTYTIAVLDYGVKRSILRHLEASGMKLTVWPASTTAEEIILSHPDGVFLSNGPGDPDPCTYAIETVQKLIGKLPLFGICLGHQLLCLALGAKTYKMPFGHHGINHPVKDLETGRVSITSQNHGFSVDPESLPSRAKISHWNLNDNTLEGITVQDAPAFSVQFHPEAAPGPNDATYLFGKFRKLIEENR